MAEQARVPWCAAALGLFVAGCGGESIASELDEPLQVHDAQFVAESLPGKPPLTGEEIRAGVKPETPRVTSFDFTGQVFHAGDSNKSLRGRASGDAFVVGLAMADSGSGYWLVPVGSPDLMFEGEYTFQASFDLGHGLAAGKQQMLLAAMDDSGNAGTQQGLTMCILPPVPDNLNACDAKLAPPELVISLDWDAAVDFDLIVVSPSGTRYDAKHPTGSAKEDPGASLTRDAGAACAFAGAKRESLVFQKRPASGRYQIYANLFSACGRPSARFNLSFYGPEPADEPGTFRQIETFRKSGIALGDQANAGTGSGLLVTELTVE